MTKPARRCSVRNMMEVREPGKQKAAGLIARRFYYFETLDSPPW